MSLRLVGKTGDEVLAHRHEPRLNLHFLRVGRHVLLGDIVADPHQEAQGLNTTSGPLFGTLWKKSNSAILLLCAPGLARPMP